MTPVSVWLRDGKHSLYRSTLFDCHKCSSTSRISTVTVNIEKSVNRNAVVGKEQCEANVQSP